jgi:FkbH-like protein
MHSAGGRGGGTDVEAAAPGPLRLTAPLKLVIWDLDESLWRGVLSEETIELDEAFGEMVRTLNRRGIVNSICSKNDPAQARARLEQLGLWDQFVFASISWEPKGPRIARMIEEMQLRGANVLFVDDNVLNLQEARHYVPDLQVAEPRGLLELLSLPEASGKDDAALTRLTQYRVLESKVLDRAASAVSNEEFLRSCEIRVELGEVGPAEVERVVELVNRSNQLNFTKSRKSAEQLHEMLSQEGRETRWVSVRDRYGDYGLCGFYSLQDGVLSDYVFSCRILNMGVEQWLYRRLGRPALEVVGEVASSVEQPASVDWIELGGAPTEQPPEPSRARARGRLLGLSSGYVLLKGGCDMWILNSFLGGTIKTEFTHPSSTGAEVHGHNCEVLRRSSPDVLAEHAEVIGRLPFLDGPAYQSRIVRAPRGIRTLIYSVLMDYSEGLYRLRDSDFVVPYGQFDVDATDPASWEALERRYGGVGVDREFLSWFADHFEFEGPIGDERFQQNIRWLAGCLPAGARLILMNAAEVPLEDPREPQRHLHHARMNALLESVVAELPNAEICDVRPFVTSEADLRDGLRHYTRQSYIRIAGHLAEIVGVSHVQHPLVSRMHRARRKVGRKLDTALSRRRLG